MRKETGTKGIELVDRGWQPRRVPGDSTPAAKSLSDALPPKRVNLMTSR